MSPVRSLNEAALSDTSQSGRPARSFEFNGELGLEGAYEADVRPNWTIASFDPRLPAVLSTPAMIGMMEAAAGHALMGRLPQGVFSVGTRIEVDHLKAVPAGAHVIATARLIEINGRFLVFDVEARSGEQLI